MISKIPDPTWEPTIQAMADPQPGDRFTELLPWWLYVIIVEPDGGPVVVLEAKAPCTVPDDGKVRRFATADEFRATYAYGTIPGYPFQLAERGNDVTGWEHRGTPWQPPSAVADLGLSALTEDANGFLAERGASVQPYQVRAVLEALPREWGYQNCGTSASAWVSLPGVVLSDSAAEKAARASAWSRNAAGNAYRVVWRAVGPPVPAEDQP